MSQTDFNKAQDDFWKAVGNENVEAAKQAFTRMQKASDDILLTRGVDTELQLAQRALEILEQ